ncbi:DUF3501 family protein [Holospora curviuscula]|uniref:DUF3501 family protein n=1 Tax=Holospora curviuscula TaxID=1082868 RepID=UPI0013FDAC0E|nr:DUF3501 family protein [Holospora curviuscula]
MIPYFSSLYTPLTLQDFSFKKYSQERGVIIPKILRLKQKRRVQLGPDLSITFEHKVLVWFQIHEMLWAERRTQGLEEEIKIYNPLIPKPDILTITAMWEYIEPEERKYKLKNLWNFISYLYVKVEDKKYFSELLSEDSWIPEEDRASSVNFLRFVLPKKVLPHSIHIHHPHYSADAHIPETVWSSFEFS